MEILTLSPQDLDELREIVQRVYSDSELAMWFDKTPTNEELNALFALKMEGIENNSAVDLIALENGKIIGECEIVQTLGAHVIGIIILKEYRRHGVGKKLLDAGIKKAKELRFGTVCAEVVEGNLPAKNFFLKNGFVITGIADRQFTRDGLEHKILYLEKQI